MNKKHDTTTTLSTTTTTLPPLPPPTTAPETTVPQTTLTVSDGCIVSETDIVCVDTSPTTTTPPPATTIPVTAPPTTEWGSPALTDVCLQHITGGPTLQPGEYMYVSTWAEATGTTEKFVGLCAPIATTSSTVATVADPPSLPETGTATPEIAMLAGVMLLAGVLARRVAR